MSLTNNFDNKTGKEWQGTNIAGLLIGYDKALAFVQEQIEAHGLDVAMTLTSDEAEAVGIDPHSDPTTMYSLRRLLKRDRDYLVDRLEKNQPWTKTDMKDGHAVYKDFLERTGYELMSKEMADEVDDDDGVTSDHDDDEEEEELSLIHI